MGYQTTYRLSWTSHPLQELEKAAIDQIVGDYIENTDLDSVLQRSGKPLDSCKWYEHEEDMARMSKIIPNVIFHLKGEGEEAGDIWDLYACNGRVEKIYAKIVHADAPDWTYQ